MNYRPLGSSGVRVSEISLGCCTLGGPNWVGGKPDGWAEIDEDEVLAAVKLAVDRGVNHFDNADQYGNGRAERVLARAFRRLGLDASRFVLASKVGHFAGTAEHAYEPAHIRHQCEQSLINLGREYLDVYYFHHADFGPGDRYLHGAVEVMDRLVQEGKVRLKGQSAYSAEAFERLVPIVRPQVLQGGANALRDRFVRPGSRVNRLMEAHGLSFVAFGPLAQGRLLDKFGSGAEVKFESGDQRAASKAFTPEALAELKPKLEKLKARFGPTPEDLAAAALNYVLAQPRVACVIPGFRNARQVQGSLAACGRALTPDDVEFIRETMSEIPEGAAV
ncbi:MAG: aldo/keto reductase [Planctomycetota bacterium]|nr:aldo/keto reductase [Planctomycetota bacterium]